MVWLKKESIKNIQNAHNCVSVRVSFLRSIWIVYNLELRKQNWNFNHKAIIITFEECWSAFFVIAIQLLNAIQFVKLPKNVQMQQRLKGRRTHKHIHTFWMMGKFMDQRKWYIALNKMKQME